MKGIQYSFFEEYKLILPKAIELSVEKLTFHAQNHPHWAIAYSGGKDSSATVSLVIHLIESGRIPKPESLRILYADTLQELPPLHESAMQMLDFVRSKGYEAEIVKAPLDRQFWVYILGRGVPSPNNGTFRWCTRQIKGDPMSGRVTGLAQSLPNGQSLLMLTGVRIGESAARDQRIILACSKDSGECGQGYFQRDLQSKIDTLAPIDHWRVCHVWDWLAEAELLYDFPTLQIAEIYGQFNSDGDEPLNTRTGCIGCPLVSGNDSALSRLVQRPQYAYLAPLLELRSIHDELRLHSNRLRKDGSETKKSGELVANPGRIGALKLDARLRILDKVLAIQERVNRAAIDQGKSMVWIINSEQEARIRELIALKTFPDRWTGDELSGDTLIPEYYSGGSVQSLLFDSLAN